MQLFDSLSVCFGNGSTASPLEGGCGWKQLGPIVNELLQNIILLGFFIATLMIFYAGYILVKGQGSPDSRSRAKKIFLNLVIGITLLVGAYYIVEFILDSIGLNDIYRQNSLPTR
jgi:hypothetical protein